jgi:hypothetical protein
MSNLSIYLGIFPIKKQIVRKLFAYKREMTLSSTVATKIIKKTVIITLLEIC